MANNLKIAIIGGGPGGLMLARVLQTHGLAATVFERELAPSARSQGGTLDMHHDTGQYALRVAGLEQEFRAASRPEDQGIRLYDPSGTIRHRDDTTAFGGNEDRPEIDRGALRQLLLDSLAPGVVRWGHKLVAVHRDDDGTCDLTFDPGITERFDLVVGADGAWSRIRPLVSDVVPTYSGITFIELTITAADTRHPELADLVGRGKMFALGGGRAIIAQRNSNARIFVYAALPVPFDWAASGALDDADPVATKAMLAGWFAGWSPELLALIHAAGPRALPWRLSALPVGHRWANRPGVTLIGDAAHVMSPFSGQGANLALRDAADLACALADATDWRDGVRNFEATMFDRAATAAAEAAGALEAVFAPDGLDHMLAHFQEHQAVSR